MTDSPNEKPEPFDLNSDDVAARKRADLKRLFPEVFDENKIDLDQLCRVMGDWIDEGSERFGLTWPGKAACMKVIQAPATGALRPDREESVNFDDSENVFVEGDNLEVLKLLQKAYFGKIKMIYIDPPYNTGREFIYPDKYAENLDTYLKYSGQADEEGQRFSTNSEHSGRFHSRWLNMLYPRLYLAKNLLSEDGFIFVSIDDNELHHLLSIMNLIYGEENHIATLVWHSEGHTDNQYDVKVTHEYVVVYAKSADLCEFQYVVDPNTRSESNVWKGIAINSITKNGKANPPSEVTLPADFPCEVPEVDLAADKLPQAFWNEVSETGYITREITKKYGVSYPIHMDDLHIAESKLTSPVRVFSGWANKNKLEAFIKGGCVPLDDEGSELTFYLSKKGVIYYRRDRGKSRNIVSVLQKMGTTEQASSALEKLGINYDYPKPVSLLSYLISMVTQPGDYVLDFFAGSGATGDAVLELSAGGEKARKFILVQLPEKIEGGRHETISALARARLRENFEERAPAEGMRAFCLGPSVFKEWRVDSTIGASDLLSRIAAHAVSAKDASNEEVLFELLLKDGFELTTKIESKNIEGATVFSVAEGALIICLERKLTKDIIDALADLAEETDAARVVCLDAGFQKDDQLKTNAVQTFKSRLGHGEDGSVFRTV
ncbi:site-specific DNA-methyltransferase [Altererythrobacter sp. MF3-039]|uniref:site-specific DNA-methyltransferase n=1 Tax=Altererythrobacter sp. MF3-039 TaxID=3252901 RepID=UPI00390C82C0